MPRLAKHGGAPEYPQFADGLRQLTIVNAALDSHRTRGWVDISHFKTGHL